MNRPVIPRPGASVAEYVDDAIPMPNPQKDLVVPWCNAITPGRALAALLSAKAGCSCRRARDQRACCARASMWMMLVTTAVESDMRLMARPATAAAEAPAGQEVQEPQHGTALFKCSRGNK